MPLTIFTSAVSMACGESSMSSCIRILDVGAESLDEAAHDLDVSGVGCNPSS